MTKSQALLIIKNEQLNNYNIENEKHLHENEVVICREKELWKVCATDERASIITGSEVFFKDESAAWDNFIMRLRADKKYNWNRTY